MKDMTVSRGATSTRLLPHDSRPTLEEPPMTETFDTRAWGAGSATSPLAPVTIRRRLPGPRDVQIDILNCGVCHSDLHQVRNEWQSAMATEYPCVPGHEIAGRV